MVLKDTNFQGSPDNNVLIRSGEARLVGWSRLMLYLGFNVSPRSVFWSADFNGRSDNTDVIRLKQMENFLRFSLKTIFAFITVAAVVVYHRPFDATIHCDYLFSGAATTCCIGSKVELIDTLNADCIDIFGRNDNEPFRLIIDDVRILGVELSAEPELGRLRVKFRSNLYYEMKLGRCEILRAQPSVQ